MIADLDALFFVFIGLILLMIGVFGLGVYLIRKKKKLKWVGWIITGVSVLAILFFFWRSVIIRLL